MQERLEDTAKQSKEMTRRAALTYLGLLGLAYDTGKDLLHDGSKLLARAEKRGAKIERTLNRRWSSVESRMTGQVRSWREQVQHRTEEFSQDLSERGKEIEDSARKFVSRVKTEGSRVSDISEIKIEVQVKEKPPIEGYDEMTVQDVLERLPGFDAEMLTEMRVYEAAHKNRVTVLREIDEQLQPSPEAEAAQ
jgi:uncharacterized protein YdaU (DUF1376 family)